MLESGDYIKFLASFFLIVIFLYSVYYYVMNFYKIDTKKNGLIEVQDRKILSKDSSLLIVKVKNRLYLLSFDKGGLKVIDRWKEA